MSLTFDSYSGYIWSSQYKNVYTSCGQPGESDTISGFAYAIRGKWNGVFLVLEKLLMHPLVFSVGFIFKSQPTTNDSTAAFPEDGLVSGHW